ncbi:hypothetical protein CXB51_026314 [Gossypium anomalum]|uniref:Uncharacterized protein n=1 Tax=Gossypium anomalum TaxID=47600 RepID=A0A8J5YFY2_9ROSI|nr:hypothetical protein CXB51_026314 [Gossypium anomalum]
MPSLLEKYFGNTKAITQAKGKGVLGGPPPGFPAKESFEAPNNLSGSQTITHKGLGFPPNELIAMSALVLMELIFRASYAHSINKHFEASVYKDVMTDLVTLRQHGIVEQYHDQLLSLPNQLQLPESYALNIYICNLKTEIRKYLQLFRPQSLVEGFHLAQQVECVVGVSPGKGFLSKGPTITRYHTVASTRVPISNQSSPLIHPPLGGLMASKMSSKHYHVGHKCVKSQLHQILLESSSENDVEEFQECSDHLEDPPTEGN